MSAKRKPADKAPVSAERKRLLFLVHALKKALGLDDDAYRAKLAGHSGKTSAADLNDGSLRELLNHWSRDLPEAERVRFTGAGWRAQSKLPEAHQRLVLALWISLARLGVLTDASDKALDAFVARQAKVTALRFLRAHAAPGVIEALKDWLAREGLELPGEIDGMDARRSLVRAQWAKLHRMGVRRLPYEEALMAWMLQERLIPGVRSLLGLTEDQLDAAARRLEAMIRGAQRVANA